MYGSSMNKICVVKIHFSHGQHCTSLIVVVDLFVLSVFLTVSLCNGVKCKVFTHSVNCIYFGLVRVTSQI